ncbi:MAG: hypothetical protein EU549_01465 [Promethearchaeota archaeon]|nr:MAG: hypothetical protein EU549_01465 [Candidatus Lokiarchaeota archaeon]
MNSNLYILLHNVSSVRIVIEFTRIALGFDIKNLIVSKAEGSAAMTGVPTAQRAVYKKGANNIFYFNDLTDVIELIKPDSMFFIVPSKYTKNKFDANKINNLLEENSKVLIAFNGHKSSFPKREMDLGEPTALELPSYIGPLGSLAIILNEVIVKH